MGSGERDAPELASAHARNAVMDSQPFVDERIVRRHQVEDASIFPHDTCAKELQLPLEGPAAGSSSKFGYSDVSGSTSASSRKRSHWAKKLVTSASDLGSVSIRRTWRSSTAGSFSRPSRASRRRSVSGMLLHRKKESRDASSRSVIG